MRRLKIAWLVFALLVLSAFIYYRVFNPTAGEDNGGRCFGAGFLLLLILSFWTALSFLLPPRRSEARGFNIQPSKPKQRTLDRHDESHR
jgi:hypothetical protein